MAGNKEKKNVCGLDGLMFPMAETVCRGIRNALPFLGVRQCQKFVKSRVRAVFINFFCFCAGRLCFKLENTGKVCDRLKILFGKGDV